VSVSELTLISKPGGEPRRKREEKPAFIFKLHYPDCPSLPLSLFCAYAGPSRSVGEDRGCGNREGSGPAAERSIRGDKALIWGGAYNGCLIGVRQTRADGQRVTDRDRHLQVAVLYVCYEIHSRDSTLHTQTSIPSK
jgi:hypothetical protein